MNNRKGITPKIAISIIAIVVLVVCGLYATKAFKSQESGIVKIEVIDINGVKLKEKDILFYQNDDIVKLIQLNFDNVVYEDTMIMEIESIKTPDDWSTFICIYVNDEMSMVGLPEIKFKDGDKISFIETKMKY